MECAHEIRQLDSDALFDRLPDEVVLCVLTELDPKSLRAWSLTSRRHQQLALDDSIWSHLCDAHFGPSLFEPPLPPHVTWRWVYQAQSRSARSAGADVGAVWVEINGTCRVFWGDVVDGQPHGFGLCVKDLDLTEDDGPARKKKKLGLAQETPTTCIAARIQGDWVQGRLDGATVEIRADGLKVERRWNQGESETHGALTYRSGAQYQGGLGWCGDPHGRGTLTLRGGATIEREWHRLDSITVRPNGNVCVHFFRSRQLPRTGIYMWPDGKRYDGEFNKYGQKHGHGIIVCANRTIYQGTWRNDKQHGHGIMSHSDGDRYEGDWAGGMRDGHGTYTWTSGQVYEGHYSQDRRHGPGIIKHANGDVYDGTYHDGRRRGRGTMSFVDGSRLSAIWDDMTYTDARIIFHRAGNDPCSSAGPCSACVALSAGASP
ncbi:Morn repeat protein [Pandoravirus inopinatum]|uniref:Morn repeat protein n=1 Tax=Pandoravirus inopinatum TaxID=1605721 RepID=A0A0B5J991_9VIRU|nr:Morn repeat protein [Pandoravirus inopinatum]AJF97416.1 Morn repeat protein [Pandoravirus inopinatum]